MNFSVLSNPLLNKFFTTVQTNQIFGPAITNLGGMVVPRTAVDYSRNKQAGKETARREIMSFINSTFVYPIYFLTVGNFLKNHSKAKSLVGLGLVSATGFGIQFYNRYLTSKETGSKAFVGLPDYEKVASEQSQQEKGINWKLWAAKAASVAGILYLTAASIAGKAKPKKVLSMLKKPGKLMKKLENTKEFLTLNQLKAYFGIAVAGRILASRDGNELRETNTRDFPAFINWLILGGCVSKLTAKYLAGKDLFNKGILKTHKVLGGNNILKGKLNASLAAGLLSSGLALGALIPLFNKRVTNKLAGKKPEENILLKEALSKLGSVSV